MHHRRRSGSGGSAAAAAEGSRISRIIRKGKQQQQAQEQSTGASLLALLVLGAFYWMLVWFAKITVYNGYITPLAKNAPLDRFSEERAMEHVWHLAHKIGGRQEGTEGLARAAEYLKSQLHHMQRRASKSIRFEVDEQLVSGSFNLHFLKHSAGLAYRNLTNIVARISTEANHNKAAVLVNGHFDSPLGSPGAGDCASCVASMLEVLRYIVDTKWEPPAPLIFLFNGAEEVFLLAAHGFITTHKWSSTIGVAINLEANGARGPDLVVQSGPETWPTSVYAQSAVVPIANSIAQDIFPLVPGDTDYRIFSKDFSDIPGLDIVLLLKGYVYHTGYDRPENLVPGGIQTRGDNLVGLVRGFSSSTELKNASERALAGGSKTKGHVFFDIFGLYMVHYTDRVALVLHTIPLLTVLLAPHFFAPKEFSVLTAHLAILEGAFLHAAGGILAIVFPVSLAIVKTSLSSVAMNWFAQPSVALLAFAPVSVAGLLFPRMLWTPKFFTASKEESRLWAAHWGALFFCALQTAIATYAGAMSAYFTCFWALFMLPALSVKRFFQRNFGRHFLWPMLGYALPAVFPAAYSLFFGTVLVQFMSEKLAMVGDHPGIMGFLVGDIVVAAVIGLVVITSYGMLIPGLAHLLAKPHNLCLLLFTGAGIATVSSVMFPYSTEAPKRVIVQHTFRTDGDKITENVLDFATVDPNSMKFVFKHAPLVHEKLPAEPQLSRHSAGNTFLPLFPISSLLSRSYAVPVDTKTPYSEHASFPKLVQMGGTQSKPERRRIHLELDLGSLKEVWAAAINITGPLRGWSFSDEKLPDPESVEGGPPSYVLRFCGASDDKWKFWLEADVTERLRVELGVLDQRLGSMATELTQQFPPWAAVVAASSYLSSYEF